MTVARYAHPERSSRLVPDVRGGFSFSCGGFACTPQATCAARGSRGHAWPPYGQTRSSSPRASR